MPRLPILIIPQMRPNSAFFPIWGRVQAVMDVIDMVQAEAKTHRFGAITPMLCN